MATSRRTGTNENVSTYGAVGQGRDYTTLTAWETSTDIDLVSATQSEVLECYDDASTFDDRVSIGGATTDSSYFRIIRPAGTIGTGSWEGHDGTPNNGVHFLNTAGSLGSFILGSGTGTDDYSSIQDLIVQMTNPDSANTISVWAREPNNSLVGIIMVDVTSANNTARGLRVSDGSVAVNCIVIRTDGWGFNCDGGSSLFLNCTAIDNGGRGWEVDGGTPISINCLGEGSGIEDFDTGFDTVNGGYNASGDGTAGDAGSTGSRINQTFTFVNTGIDDYHLSPSDAGAKTFGTDLSASGSFQFDDDIDGDLRS